MFKEQIAKGAKLLDEKCPILDKTYEWSGDTDWTSTIDTTYLDMDSTTSCILGQLAYKRYGSSFWYMVSNLMGKDVLVNVSQAEYRTFMIEHGFMVEAHDADSHLALSWKNYLKERQVKHV